MTMTNSSRKSPRASGVVGIASAILAVLVLVVGPLLPGAFALVENAFAQIQSSTASTHLEESPTPEPTVGPTDDPDLTDNPDTDEPLSPELMERLDASAVSTSSICLGIIEKYGQLGDEANRNSSVEDTYALFLHVLETTPPKYWSDALSIAFAGIELTNDDLLGLVKRAICEEPVIGSTFMYMMTHNQINGIDLVDLQKTDWADEIASTDIEDLDEFIQQFVPLAFAEDQNKSLSEIKLYRIALAANHEYQVFASKAVFILSRYEFGGLLPNFQSTTTYHLVNGGLTADGIPEIEVAENETLPALVFYLTEKAECKPISVVGFNFYDKRPELGEIPADCESLIPPPPPSGDCVINCGEPDCVVNCDLADKPADEVYWLGAGEDDGRDAGDGDKGKEKVDGESKDEPVVQTTPTPSPSPSQSNEGGDN
jgi:hypothetical protein